MTVCKNCGTNIVKSPYRDEEWTHQVPGASGTDGMHLFCYLNVAEPEDELPSRCVHCNGPGNSHLRSCPMSIATSDIDAVRKELEQAKLLYNDLARENEALREAGQMTPDVLKKYCDNARAYGWEAGRLYGLASSVDNDIPKLEPSYNSHPSNPFTNPDWDAELKLPRQGWNVTFIDAPL